MDIGDRWELWRKGGWKGHHGYNIIHTSAKYSILQATTFGGPCRAQNPAHMVHADFCNFPYENKTKVCELFKES